MQDLVPIAVWLVELAWLVLTVAGVWRTFAKAGHPGWTALVPVYNLVVLARVGRQPGAWVLLLLVPLVNIFVLGLLSVHVAWRFRRGWPFGLGLLVLPIVFYPWLGFGQAKAIP
ncbi:MAG: DUF5684 domain-containing protein [Planctomycetes bacterium]|nr:DUF5684 domain-containing protein [Planctomycetota bacterium]